MKKSIKIPVAYCFICQKHMPVVVKTLKGEDVFDDIEEDLRDESFQAVWCPGCEDFLNFNRSVSIMYYDPKDVPQVTNWRLSDDF